HVWPDATSDKAGQDGGDAISATVWVGIPPQISQVAAVSQVPVGQPVQLRPDVTGSGPIAQTWYLGDGRRLTVNDPVVVYPATGIYQVTLDAANPLQTVSRTHIITVVPHAVAQFTAEDWTVGVDQPVNFINQSGGQPPLSYRWEFGDGLDSTEANPSHIYAAPGSYLVHLLITNGYGQSEAYGLVTVGLPPVADLVIPPSVPAGVSMAGQAYGDDTVQSYVWDMGDGRFREGSAINHTYILSGDYYVLLTASNEYGSTQAGRWIHVDPGALSTYLPLIVNTNEGTAVLADSELYPLDLEPVELTEEFHMEPVELPANLTQAERLLFYINEARHQFDLPPLHQIYALNVAAQQHVDDMADYAYTAHVGSDGSYPVERLLTFGYHAGYAGEATAWGFEHAYEAVEFWVNSPPHRRIILNRNATDVGVGYRVDFNAPNVWYWTAEFGNAYGPQTGPFLRLSQPEAEYASYLTSLVDYRWNWPLPLDEDESFAVYLYDGRQAQLLGEVNEPALGTLYRLQASAYDTLALQADGTYQWQVKLQKGQTVLAESDLQPIVLTWDTAVPFPTPVFTPTPTATPELAPTPTSTPSPVWPTATPIPTLPPQPIFPTAAPDQ
ncbi:MAG: PKD domain-containing protein, partial [Anaerolineales bacterium]|nr:PKD domain-containing protein [Anaerolineales bacterium]